MIERYNGLGFSNERLCAVFALAGCVKQSVSTNPALKGRIPDWLAIEIACLDAAFCVEGFFFVPEWGVRLEHGILRQLVMVAHDRLWNLGGAATLPKLDTAKTITISLAA